MIKIFNEKNVDEIIVLDIDASVKKNKPNFKLIEQLASVCRMPMCYGGGVKRIEDVFRILNLGIEKVCLSSAAIENPKIISKIAKKVGSQSIAVCVDVKLNLLNNNFEVFLFNGSKKINKNLENILFEMQSEGVGEIIINSIDRDGTMNGFHLDILEKHKHQIKVPSTIIGGAKVIQI